MGQWVDGIVFTLLDMLQTMLHPIQLRTVLEWLDAIFLGASQLMRVGVGEFERESFQYSTAMARTTHKKGEEQCKQWCDTEVFPHFRNRHNQM